MSFDPVSQKKIMQELRTFVREKGVVQDPTTRHARRPRTCIFTCSEQSVIEMAEVVWLVTPVSIQRITGDRISQQLKELNIDMFRSRQSLARQTLEFQRRMHSEIEAERTSDSSLPDSGQPSARSLLKSHTGFR
eukprot:gnl/TRDRNA2_/TRDRNA2_142094_c0_seq1.p1 gnl/TRDRNA2_/TRDRNA2_142094_c0~~gnl/TRDRNA2_/TRDRNA2_142094_c0_seq1.p1  ORF type:complete len:134 (+),score=17.24 gnl/TRDRNA2_/TRDRNA2_142094_c0_seq1:501-902(+)